MYVGAYETSSKTKFLLDHALSMDYVCNRCLFSIPSKVEMAEEQEYLRSNSFLKLNCNIKCIVLNPRLYDVIKATL